MSVTAARTIPPRQAQRSGSTARVFDVAHSARSCDEKPRTSRILVPLSSMATPAVAYSLLRTTASRTALHVGRCACRCGDNWSPTRRTAPAESWGGLRNPSSGGPSRHRSPLSSWPAMTASPSANQEGLGTTGDHSVGWGEPTRTQQQLQRWRQAAWVDLSTRCQAYVHECALLIAAGGKHLFQKGARDALPGRPAGRDMDQ